MISENGQILAYTFSEQFWFDNKIKTSHKTVLRSTWIFDLTEKWGSQQLISVLGPRQKWVKFLPTFFKLFIYFHFGQLSPILTFFIKSNSNIYKRSNYFSFYGLGQNFWFLTMWKVKIGNNLPKWKKFYMLESTLEPINTGTLT